jgi:hypothetical protein
VTAYQDAHNADCETCTEAISRPPQPFDADMCHMNISPGNELTQCPHPTLPPVPGSPARVCEHHLEAIARMAAHIAVRKAPFN